jgi:hypothetical protein
LANPGELVLAADEPRQLQRKVVGRLSSSPRGRHAAEACARRLSRTRASIHLGSWIW